MCPLQLISTMSLQVMGNIEPGTKAVLWSETRQPIQTWTTQMRGIINSVTFPGMVLDVKGARTGHRSRVSPQYSPSQSLFFPLSSGGKTYDKDHVVIMPESEERPSQQWEIELL